MKAVSRNSARVYANPGLAIIVAIVLLLITVPAATARNLPLFMIQIATCLLGGLAVLRPVPAGWVQGFAATFLVIIPDAYLDLAVLALVVPIVVTAIQGRRIWSLVFGAWYLAICIALTAEAAKSAADLARGVNFWVVFMFAPLLLGEVMRRLQQRAEKQRKAQILAAERQRRAIARDLHDTLTYATTTMVMRAEQARLRGGHDGQTVSDLDFIAATGRSATADLRTMLAMLRDSDSEVHNDPDPLGLLPASRLEEVLVAQAAKLRAFDFEVNLSTNGEPAGMSERVSTIVARVVTEAASNITKHGDPCQEVTVMLDFDPPDVEAVFVNGIRSDEPDSGHHGLGLLGLQEIVAAEGGTLTSDQVASRWITHLTLPSGAPVRGGNHGL